MWKLGVEDVYTHTHTGNPLACAGALVVLEEVPKLLPRDRGALASASPRRAGTGKGCCALRRAMRTMRARNGVLVIPVGNLIQAAPPFTLTDAELDEAFARLARLGRRRL